MNKTDLTRAISEKADLTLEKAAKTIDLIFQEITQALKTGDTVMFVGFGTFKAVKKAARQGRNPRTGEAIQIAATISPKFTAGKGLKDAVNG